MEMAIREENFGCPELVETMIKILDEEKDTASQNASFCKEMVDL
jgi:hypothetical protein